VVFHHPARAEAGQTSGVSLTVQGGTEPAIPVASVEDLAAAMATALD
jgi:hypothetical protein